MSNLTNAINEDAALCETTLRVKLTNKGMLIYGAWSKEKLLSLLKDKLVQRREIESSPAIYNDARDASVKLHSIIHSGIYNECILMELERKGTPACSIMKAIKYGLLSLGSDELRYFRDFGAEARVIENIDTWAKKLDERLIWNLVVAGLTESQCWNVVTCGLVSQDENLLCRLLSSGVDVPGILSWPGQIKPVTSTVVRFLKRLGLDEGTLRNVEINGIDDEAEDMLIDLGYNEYKEKNVLEVTEEILCECSLTILESASTASSLAIETSRSCDLNKTALSLSSTDTRYSLAPFACACYLDLSSKKQDDATLTRNDYLRQTVMVPLSWAISRALRYRPSDPGHYIAHQLLRWKYGNVAREEAHGARRYVASATTALDRRLIEKHKREDEDAVRRLNEAAVRDIICNVCLERQELHRIKERCWRCTRVPISLSGKCGLPRFDSSSDTIRSSSTSSSSTTAAFTADKVNSQERSDVTSNGGE